MKSVFHNKKWKSGALQLHVDPPPTPLLKSNHDDNSDKDFVNLKFCRDLRSEKLYLYEFKKAFFDNGNPEDYFVSF